MWRKSVYTSTGEVLAISNPDPPYSTNTARSPSHPKSQPATNKLVLVHPNSYSSIKVVSQPQLAGVGCGSDAG